MCKDSRYIEHVLSIFTNILYLDNVNLQDLESELYLNQRMKAGSNLDIVRASSQSSGYSRSAIPTLKSKSRDNSSSISHSLRIDESTIDKSLSLSNLSAKADHFDIRLRRGLKLRKASLGSHPHCPSPFRTPTSFFGNPTQNPVRPQSPFYSRISNSVAPRSTSFSPSKLRNSYTYPSYSIVSQNVDNSKINTECFEANSSLFGSEGTQSSVMRTRPPPFELRSYEPHSPGSSPFKCPMTPPSPLIPCPYRTNTIDDKGKKDKDAFDKQDNAKENNLGLSWVAQEQCPLNILDTEKMSTLISVDENTKYQQQELASADKKLERDTTIAVQSILKCDLLQPQALDVCIKGSDRNLEEINTAFNNNEKNSRALKGQKIPFDSFDSEFKKEALCQPHPRSQPALERYTLNIAFDDTNNFCDINDQDDKVLTII